MSTMAKNEPITVDDQSLFFRQIIDSSPALLHTARPDGYLDFFNQTWLDFAGEPMEKLLGWGWTSCIHPEDVETFVQKMRESFARESPFRKHHECEGPMGSIAGCCTTKSRYSMRWKHHQVVWLEYRH